MEYSLKNTEALRGDQQIRTMKRTLVVGKTYKVRKKVVEGKTASWSRAPMVLLDLFEHFALFWDVKGGYRVSENYQDLYAQRATL